MPVDVTDKYIRIRQKEPDLFQKDTFRTIRLTSGIKAIIGKIKGEKTTTVQSLLFDKERFTVKQAKKWVSDHKSKFTEALKMEKDKETLFSKEKTKMSDDKMEKKEITTFSDESSVTKLKEILVNILNCDSLEKAKEYAEGLKELIPEEDNKEPEDKKDESKDEPKDKTEGEPKDEPKADADAPEDKKTDEPTGDKTDLKNEGVADVLALNDNLIESLKEANTQIDVLEKINTNLKNEIKTKETEIETFKSVEKDKKQTIYNNKLKEVSNKWVSTFSIKSDKEKESVKEMLSSFSSEDKLEEISRYLALKETTKRKMEPIVMTAPSEFLKKGEEGIQRFGKETYTKLSAREKTDYLFSLIEKQEKN